MFIADVPYADTLRDHMIRSVRFALEEDIGGGDITAELIPAEQTAEARVITREAGVLCGREWFDEVFRQVDHRIELTWHKEDGDTLTANDTLLTLSGPARTILTAERTALNFLQMLSGTATEARKYADATQGTGVTVLDTRKTLPTLRLAQKYAVKVGGCENHRLGLYDRFLIKENHIAACGGITAAVELARKKKPDTTVEVEVETLDQLEEAVSAHADIVMLDNFDSETTQLAAKKAREQVTLESSGNLGLSAILEAGPQQTVHYASSGAISKHVRALDLSLKIARNR